MPKTCALAAERTLLARAAAREEADRCECQVRICERFGLKFPGPTFIDFCLCAELYPVKRMTRTSTKPNPIVELCPIRLINLGRRIGINAMRHRFVAALTASASFVMLLTSVHISLADVIDGDWCRADGKRMKIRGPDIVTPGGNQTRGDYTRHSFSYVVPAGEVGAGESVSIILLSEYLAHARQGSDTAPVQVWNRCPPGIADSRPALAVEKSG